MNKYINKHTTILVILSIILLIQGVSAAQTKVIITFDDGWTSQYYTAFPIMQINNQEGTLFVVSNYANLGSGIQNEWAYMNISQLKALYSLNWDVSSHTLTHAHLTSINSTDLQNELNASMLWLNNNGFVKSSMFLAYPYGEYNNNVINAVKKNGYIAARTVDKNNGLYPQYTISSPDVLKMKTLVAYGIPGYGNNATPPDYIKNEINKTVETNGLLIITFHHIIDDSQTQNYPEEYHISDFKSISDFLKIEQDAGKLDVVTMSKYFGTPTPPPIPTPITYISHIKLANGFYKVDGQSPPSIINATKGDSVKWINDGSNSVTLVSIENLWTNKTLKRNAKFSYIFNIIGKYHIYLSGYPNRNQTINVN